MDNSNRPTKDNNKPNQAPDASAHASANSQPQAKNQREETKASEIATTALSPSTSQAPPVQEYDEYILHEKQKYFFKHEIARGAFGIVYMYQTAESKPMAIKVAIKGNK